MGTRKHENIGILEHGDTGFDAKTMFQAETMVYQNNSFLGKKQMFSATEINSLCFKKLLCIFNYLKYEKGSIEYFIFQ